jgi:hypothetical protein
MMPRINCPQISSWGETKFPSSTFKANATTQRERGRKSPEARTGKNTKKESRDIKELQCRNHTPSSSSSAIG